MYSLYLSTDAKTTLLDTFAKKEPEECRAISIGNAALENVVAMEHFSGTNHEFCVREQTKGEPTKVVKN